MLYSVIREIISLTAPDRKCTAAGVATVTIFVLVVVLLLLVNIVYIICWRVKIKNCLSDSDGRTIAKEKTVVFLVEIIGATLYFIGDNIVSMEQYGEVLGCGPICVENIRIASVILLALALILYNIFPPFLHKIVKIIHKDFENTAWYSASGMIATILKIDTVYTAVVIMAQTDNFCSKIDLSISITVYIICVVAGIFSMIVSCVSSSVNLKSENNTKKCWWIVPISCIILIIVFPLHMLADNLQPLDCAFGCDSFSSNETQNNISCNVILNSAVRLGFAVTSFISVLIISSILFCKHIEKLKKHNKVSTIK